MTHRPPLLVEQHSPTYVFNDNVSNTQLLCTFLQKYFLQDTKLNAKKIGHFDYDKRNFLKKSWQVNFFTLPVGSTKLLLVSNISVQNKYKLINE